MARGDLGRKPVAFVITISGIIDVDYEEGNMTPVEAFEAATVRNQLSDVEWILRDAIESDVTIRPSHARNYLNSLGGYFMGDVEDATMCVDCGRVADHPAGECR